ncbi:hypothetical protein ASG96_02225 [Terrabacter sp. Soil810]|nr:hypothetical protein ASG96_02225 [Terrabacter sp. Soil810]
MSREKWGPVRSLMFAVSLVVLGCIVVACFAFVMYLNSGPKKHLGASDLTTRPVTCGAPRALPTDHPTFTAAPPGSAAQGSTWDVSLSTTCGDVRISLDGRAAPRSVASFVMLARAGYWGDSVCRRLTTLRAPTHFLQCGDPSGRGTADLGFSLPLENVPVDRTYHLGDVGLARGDRAAATAGEFFIVHDTFQVPPGGQLYSVVGHVSYGLEVVDFIAHRGGKDQRPDGPPLQPVSVLGVAARPIL